MKGFSERTLWWVGSGDKFENICPQNEETSQIKA